MTRFPLLISGLHHSWGRADAECCKGRSLCQVTDLVEEEVVDVVGEEGSELALLRLAGAHAHLELLNESAVKGDRGHELSCEPMDGGRAAPPPPECLS